MCIMLCKCTSKSQICYFVSLRKYLTSLCLFPQQCLPTTGPPAPPPLTDVQDAVPWPAPPPPIQLLLLCVLQAPVVENHTHHALGAQQGTAHRSEGAWAFGNQFLRLG